MIFDLPQESTLREAIAPRRDLPDLTGRQREILVLLAGGLSNKQIARQLAISHFTVRNHVSHILRAFNLKTRRQAMNWFNTIIGPDKHATASPE
ncbi:MAG: two component transcriptional regulator LuxR [Beijerinckiaceae bacterium]|nr:MAG: two component transcriptional regulator LuxR [Beijerinckiaceae bacterium]